MRVCGLMDKAPDFGSGDCRFESCHARSRKNFCRSVEISALYATFVIVLFVNANGCRRQGRLCGATVARLTPDQKAACSNHVRVMQVLFWNRKSVPYTASLCDKIPGWGLEPATLRGYCIETWNTLEILEMHICPIKNRRGSNAHLLLCAR